MSTVELCGGVPFGEVVNGPPPQWRDGSDATWATAETSPSVFGSSNAGLDLIPLTEPAARVTAVTLTIRCAVTAPAAAGSPIPLSFGLFPAVGAGINGFWTVAADGVPHEYTVAVDPADIAEGLGPDACLLNIGFHVHDFGQPDYGADLPEPAVGSKYEAVIYEMSVLVTLGGIAPPLRQFPRTDGLGTSSTRRLWPPPRSVQRSNRRAGGYR